MHHFNPTALDASYAKLALSNRGLKARVRRFPTSLRICLDGVVTQAMRDEAAAALREWNLVGVTGGALTWDGYQTFAHKVR